jgi:uncharacterized protein (DUF58 family)
VPAAAERWTGAASARLLRRLEWQVLRRLDGQLQGSHRTHFYGTGIDFADLRTYTPEDDVRHIDWNVTARLDEPHVRQYTEDRELTAWLLLDRSPSMVFGAADRSKDVVLTELAVTLARLLAGGGNRVGAILFDRHVDKVLPARSGRAHVLRLAHDLGRRQGVPTPPGAPTDLAALLHAAAGTIRRRSLVFVISDFITGDGWERPLARLARRHEVVAVRVLDPLERELPDVGMIVVEDAETGEQVMVDTGDPAFRRRFHAEVDARDDALHAALDRLGVRLDDVATDDDLVTALVAMVQRSKRPRR